MHPARLKHRRNSSMLRIVDTLLRMFFRSVPIARRLETIKMSAFMYLSEGGPPAAGTGLPWKPLTIRVPTASQGRIRVVLVEVCGIFDEWNFSGAMDSGVPRRKAYNRKQLDREIIQIIVVADLGSTSCYY